MSNKIIVNDPVHHPKHYTEHPSGIECITITEHMGFNLGNAVKYIWRADLKGFALQDLEKAAWYVQREIEKRKAQETTQGALCNLGQPVPGEIRILTQEEARAVLGLKE